MPCFPLQYSLQYHCHFDDIFETTRHGAPDVSSTIFWQQLANSDHATTILSKVSMSKQHSIISFKTPSEEEAHTASKPIFEPPVYDVISVYYSVLDQDLHVSENSCTSWRTQASHTNEGVTPIEPTVTASTSQCRRVCTMSRRMAESVS